MNKIKKMVPSRNGIPVTGKALPSPADAKTVKEAIQRQKIAAEEKCIKEVLRNFLDREPTIDDAKRCSQKISEPWDGSYELSYNKVPIGVVQYIENEEQFRVEFTPFKVENARTEEV